MGPKCLYRKKKSVQSRRVTGCTNNLVLCLFVPWVWEAGGTTFVLGVSISIF